MSKTKRKDLLGLDENTPTAIALKLRHPVRRRSERIPVPRGLGIKGSGWRLRPLIESLSQKQIDKLIEKARALDPHAHLPDFSRWRQVRIPPGPHVEDLVKAFREVDEVETAYVMRQVPQPASQCPHQPTLAQGYLGAKPDGIDALTAWGYPGGNGAGINFVDMESGWNLNHADLPTGIKIIYGVSNDSFDHGTSALGVVLMKKDGAGGTGIAYGATGQVTSQVLTKGATYNNPSAIVNAAAKMKYGDVLLLEVQDADPTFRFPSWWPVEVADGTYEAILLATALGIVVVEAAGNGENLLNDYTNLAGEHIFDRNYTGEFRDSGAIIVGGAKSATTPELLHIPEWASNYGNRIDCYAWGENIDTTSTNGDGTDDCRYTWSFDGTSGASAIIAGAALVVQGLAQASLGYRFSPGELRRILNTNGTWSTPRPQTPSATPPPIPKKDVIGVMPDLAEIITTNELNLAPDIYVRDSIADKGDPASGDIASESPDIIVRQNPVTDPQAAYGAGSGTENDPGLSEDVVPGQPNYVYVRLSNRGGSVATAVSVDVYAAPVATFQNPKLWTKISPPASVPSVPSGNALTVCGAVAWTPPGPGQYAFIAVAGSAEDPNPGIPSFQSGIPGFSPLDQYLAWVGNNNNVAFRNFNVVSVPSPGPSSDSDSSSDGSAPLEMRFLIPGFDSTHVFELEGFGHLPARSRAWIEVPDWFADALQPLPCKREKGLRTRTVRIRLNPGGLQRLGAVRLSGRRVAKCRLVVKLPKSNRLPGQFSVRQMYQKREVGRVTWRFVPVRKAKSKGRKAAPGMTIPALKHQRDGKSSLPPISPAERGRSQTPRAVVDKG